MSKGSHEVCEAQAPANCEGFPCSHTTALSPFDELIGKLHNVISFPPSESTSYAMQANPYYRGVFSVLCDKKLPRRSVSAIISKRPHLETPRDDSVTIRIMEQSTKLDHMIDEFYQLANEEGASSSVEDGQSFEEYRTSLEDIQSELHHHYGRMNQHSADMSTRLREVLDGQRHYRPISSLDIEKSLQALQHKHLHCQNELKQIVCHKLMLSRSRLDESRKKRRNFSKRATQILTKYFNSHVDSPYPTEEDKVKLAVECNITVAQVSNWFGNKRIRDSLSIGLPSYGVGQCEEPHGTEPFASGVYDAHNSFAYSAEQPVEYNYNVQMQNFGTYQSMEINDRYSAT
uniref:Homeobox domain-containing protein n=1 Tax=Steinernema glaseri TaxID=37863 RepID=A0A1I8A7B3_9BILA